MLDSLTDFLHPINVEEISNDIGYKEGQIGRVIKAYDREFPDLDEASIILLGCGEQRGTALLHKSDAANVIRREFYNLYQWHQDISLADIGNLKIGKTLYDTYAALQVVLGELQDAGKTIIILGGSHDLTLGQYYAYSEKQQAIEAVGVDSLIDINLDSPFRADNFLMELLTAEPNYMRHYNHIGFQSYFVHPRMLETMDKLRFDCFRVGHVKEHLEEMEPVIRNCQLFSFDMSAIAHAFAPANTHSANGFNGEEACTLMQYAGMSPNLRSLGLYNYRPERDYEALTAKQISQMLWYFIDGRNRGNMEALPEERVSFNEFYTAFAEVETVFLQSKKTGRWWMQLPDKKYIACSQKDYVTASSNEIPERWLRAQERQ
ncbi:MAG TPA: formimidoylglutamase [Flavisolibacter sp.]|nr:formimidoylglutamase [Flavisolibacter sp.]